MAKISPVTTEKRELESLIEQVLHRAKQRGASSAEVSVSRQWGFNISVRMGEVDTLEFNKDKGVSITVYQGQKQGHASSSDTSPEALEQCLDKALYIAQHTQEDSFAGLAEKDRLATEFPDLDLYHPWGLTPEEAIALAKKTEETGLKSDKRLINSEGVSVSTGNAHSAYGNSNGFLGSVSSSRHGVDCVFVAKVGDEMQRDYDYTVARSPEDLEDFSQIALNAAEKTVQRLGAKPIKTCSAPVIFIPSMARRLLGNFIQGISGGNLYRRASFLLDTQGKQIFNPIITLREEPYLKRGLGSAAFDREGVKTTPRALVKEGVLQGYVLSSYSSRKLGLTTTGNAGGVHNMLVEKGSDSLQALIKKMHKGLLLTDMMGMGVNIVTGDFSQGASGFWVENGEIQHPVEEITIAGNLRQMFQQIIAVGKDVDKRGSIQTPSMLIESMTIAGN